ncbi:MAG: Gfo/Idh/MocA family protein [Pseudomonadales bacterium]
MVRVKILGAGSIGNHLAHACRGQGWHVTLCDPDAAALQRTRVDIYPSRYGQWDQDIELTAPTAVAGQPFDLVIIGTPPDTHVALALAELETPPRVLMVEKPLSTPDLCGVDQLAQRARDAGTRILVGYNHRLTRHTQLAAEWLAAADLGAVTTLRVLFREHWGGIFGAHPWLAGPADSYLGFTTRGGGALGEHSHGINLWQHFAALSGQGRIIEVAAMIDEVAAGGAHYDRIAQLSVRSESGLVGSIVQDVVTRPAQKWLRLEAERGNLEWQANVDPDHDLVRLMQHGGEAREERVAKTRPDDFRGEIEHVAQLLEAPGSSSVLDLEAGIDTMRVIAAALESARTGRLVRVDYQAPTPELPC